MRTRVVIVGGGPSGSLLSLLLAAGGVDSVVLERRNRDYVLSRIRAGVLEHQTAEVLGKIGVGARLESEGAVHEGIRLAAAGRTFRVDFQNLVGRSVRVYGQTQVQDDLYRAMDDRRLVLLDEVGDVEIHQPTSEAPFVTFVKDGERERIDCEFVAGCDGYHGVSRATIPEELRRTFEREYPFGWLGVLSETPPVDDELIYANHEQGFALCSMRSSTLSRYYLQCPAGTDAASWSDDRFWSELVARLPEEAGSRLVTGPSIEKSVTPLRSFVSEPMRFGRLFLAGDAAHIVPPTGAKGLNLAVSDVVYLAEGFVSFFRDGSLAALDAYPQRALSRVWNAVRFSWWMTRLLHRFPDDGDFGLRLQEAEFDYLASSAAARTALAENYTGRPLERFDAPRQELDYER